MVGGDYVRKLSNLEAWKDESDASSLLPLSPKCHKLSPKLSFEDKLVLITMIWCLINTPFSLHPIFVS